MKSSTMLPLAASLSLVGCGQMVSNLQQPITSDYNPLDGPSAPSLRNKSFQPTGPTFKPGEWVETAMPNSTFFYKIPKGNATADQVLGKGSPLKVISTKGSYVKVELEGGTVGFVPAIMVAEPSSASDSTPFLPPPPTAPLQRSTPINDSFAPPSIPDVAPSPLESGGSSLIPPPSNYSGSGAAPSGPVRKPTEILIPTSPNPAPEAPLSPVAPSGGGLIPAPTGTTDTIDQTIGIE